MTLGIVPPYTASGPSYCLFLMMAIHSFDTATFHASPILAVMLNWIGTQCTTLMKLLIIIKDVGSGGPCVNRSSLMVKWLSQGFEPTRRTLRKN